jgi:hypothetical protein
MWNAENLLPGLAALSLSAAASTSAYVFGGWTPAFLNRSVL